MTMWESILYGTMISFFFGTGISLWKRSMVTPPAYGLVLALLASSLHGIGILCLIFFLLNVLRDAKVIL